MSLTPHGKQLTVFVAENKKGVFKHELDNFSIFRDYSDEIGGVINKGDFFDIFNCNVSTMRRSAKLSEPMSKSSMRDVTLSQMGKNSIYSKYTKDQWVLT